MNTNAKNINKKRIAIIGTGISGIGAAWHLQNHCEIELFESEDQIGGHSHSVKFDDLWIDMGFIVFNEPCYPNLVELFKATDTKHQLSDMSFGVSMNNGSFEYSSLGLKGLFAQKRNLFNPRFYQMIKDVLRFNKYAAKDSEARNNYELTLGEYLLNNKYSDVFIYDHLLPQAAAIWSASSKEIMEFPFATFIRFFENHGLLQLKDRILWRSVIGGAQAYLKQVTKDIKGKIHTSCGIKSIIRTMGGVILIDINDQKHEFDEVILATHSDTSLKILGENANQKEIEILKQITYRKNKVVLHTDINLMPKRRNSWASWNYISDNSNEKLCVSYYMNLLQVFDAPKDYFVTLNPIREISPDKILKIKEFDHPYFDKAALNAQKQLPQIQGKDKVWFCGAYFGYGFHEDGLESGLAIAEAISGIKRPWNFDYSKSRIIFDFDKAIINA